MIFDKEPILHVGILLNETIRFELKGKFRYGGQNIHAGIYKAWLVNGKIETSFAKETAVIELHPAQNSTFVLKNVAIGIGFHWQQQEDQEFEGGLIFQVENGKIRVVNAVPLETYLCSVISSEMSAMNDPVLLKVHAIVSRSWVLAQIQHSFITETNSSASVSIANSNNKGEKEIINWYDHKNHKTFDVCADDHCQRYQGITKIISDKARKAVEATRGQVLMFGNKICDARFSKCCGGITENFENVWQPVKVPYLTSVRDIIPDKILNPVRVERIEKFITSSPDAFCNTSDPEVLRQVLIDFDQNTTDFFRWNVAYTQNQLSELIYKKSGINFGSIVDLIPLERGTSGRIIRLKIVGEQQTVIVGKELEIRRWLSKSHLHSSAFVVEKKYKGNSKIPLKFVLKGAGWGHGVGMCQIGAAVMSRQGYTVTQILNHYFKETTVKKL